MPIRATQPPPPFLPAIDPTLIQRQLNIPQLGDPRLGGPYGTTPGVANELARLIAALADVRRGGIERRGAQAGRAEELGALQEFAALENMAWGPGAQALPISPLAQVRQEQAQTKEVRVRNIKRPRRRARAEAAPPTPRELTEQRDSLARMIQQNPEFRAAVQENDEVRQTVNSLLASRGIQIPSLEEEKKEEEERLTAFQKNLAEIEGREIEPTEQQILAGAGFAAPGLQTLERRTEIQAERAQAASGPLTEIMAGGEETPQRLEAIFLDPGARQAYLQWKRQTGQKDSTFYEFYFKTLNQNRDTQLKLFQETQDVFTREVVPMAVASGEIDSEKEITPQKEQELKNRALQSTLERWETIGKGLQIIPEGPQSFTEFTKSLTLSTPKAAGAKPKAALKAGKAKPTPPVKAEPPPPARTEEDAVDRFNVLKFTWKLSDEEAFKQLKAEGFDVK